MRLSRPLLGLLLALIAAPALALSPVTPADMAIGNPKAKVTVVEYASLSCPHCAHFANTVFPAFKKKYVDTGKVRFVYREFLTEPAALAAAPALLARCAGPKRYFAVIETFFAEQPGVYASGNARPALMKAAKAGGLSEARADACVKDEAAQKALYARVQNAVEADGVDSTPTFFVNGVKLEGDHQLADLDKAIAAASRQ